MRLTIIWETENWLLAGEGLDDEGGEGHAEDGGYVAESAVYGYFGVGHRAG